MAERFLDAAREMARRVRELTGANRPKAPPDTTPDIELDENGKVVYERPANTTGEKVMAFRDKVFNYPASLVTPASPQRELDTAVKIAKLRNDIDKVAVPAEAKLEQMSTSQKTIADAVRRAQQLQQPPKIREPIQQEREFSNDADKQAYIDSKKAPAAPVTNDLEGSAMGAQSSYNKWLVDKATNFRNSHVEGTDRAREAINAAKRWGVGLDKNYEQKAAQLPVVRDIKAGQQKAEEVGNKYIAPWLEEHLPVHSQQGPVATMPEVTVEGTEDLRKKR